MAMKKLFFVIIVMLVCTQQSFAEEGLFDPASFFHSKAIDVMSVVESTVKIDMSFAVKLDIFNHVNDQIVWDKQTPFFTTTGTYVTYKGFLKSDKKRCEDKHFQIEPGNFEFCRYITHSASFPKILSLVTAIGTGVFISNDGYILTAYHVAQACIIDNKVINGKYDFKPLKCRNLKVYQSHFDPGSNKITYQDVGDVWLVANSSYNETFPSPQHQALDFAILKVDVNPSHYLTLDGTFALKPHTRLYISGFPFQTHRPPQHLKSIGYRDADSTLRFSTGVFLRQDGNSNFISDIDVWRGNSGSPTINTNGKIVGIAIDCIGSKNDAAFLFNSCQTQHVTIKSICQRLDMLKKLTSVQGCLSIIRQ